MTSRVDTTAAPRSAASKVPGVTAVFWAIKILTTGMGETLSDFLVTHVPPALAIGTAGLALVASLVAQFRAHRCRPGVYWTAVVLVSVFGTMAADVAHVGFRVPYAASTALFGLALAAVFWWWRRSEGTLSVHSIVTRRREACYWAVVMLTFALGTAAGDLTATTLRLGYFPSAVLFAVAIAVPAAAHRWAGLGSVAAFWSAYVITRPLGASLADWLAAAHHGGLGLGTGPVSLAWSVAIAALVAAQARGRACRGDELGGRASSA